MFTMHKEGVAPGHPGLLLAIATLLGLSCTLLFGADPSGDAPDRPGALPGDMDEIARPIESASPPLTDVRQALAAHTAGRLVDAIDAWRQLDVPREVEVWRHVSMGVASLYRGDFIAADEDLQAAVDSDPDNAVAHYFMGLLRREQAATAADYDDSVRTTPVRFARHTASDPERSIQGKTRSRLLLEAIDAFELAILNADQLDLGQPLAAQSSGSLATSPLGAEATPATVGELLDVLGADNFVGKSHGLLGHLYLDLGRPDEAEAHVDQAAMHGIPVPRGYGLVGRLYREQGRNIDAQRAYEKARQLGDGLDQPDETAIEAMSNAWEKLL